MPQTGKFTFRFYFQTLTRVLGEPGKFFSEFPENAGFKQPTGFLIISSIFFAAASLLTNGYPRPFMTGGIFFINAVGMTFIASGLGFIAMTMIMGKRVSFVKFFSIYAFSSGVTLLASWVPFFIFLTEPWKWWLIGTGLTKGCEFGWGQAIFIIGASLGVIILFFWSISPILF